MTRLKSSLFLSLFFLLLSTNTSAQVITFEPSFATQYDSLVVTFDATQGNGELAGFTGDVYLHTGVITNNSVSNSNWLYVPNNWDSYPEKVKATPLGNDKWQFTYGPSIREFFGVTSASEDVLQVAMLFRGTFDGSGNPDAVGRASDGGDIFIELTTGEASARFVTPEEDFRIIENTETVNITGIGNVNSGTLSLSLLKNETEVSATVRNDSLFYSYTPEPGDENITFELIASNGAELADTAEFKVTVKQGNGELIARPSGLKDGISYESESSVRLSLFAPMKEFVYVIGDFNDWTPSSEYLMNKEVGANDSVWFWLQVDGLTPGEQYGFQYLVDGEIRVADPYSELILDQYNDRFIPETVYPDLKPYPTDETSEAVTLLEPGKTLSSTTSGWVPPAQDELVIYELLIRDFLDDHSYKSLIDTLDYLEDLGINAIELMPVSEFDGNESWGYNPSFHYALDKYYGTQQDFINFVDAAHARGMAVIVDVVLNHASGQNPYVRLYNNGGTSGPTADNPYFFTEGQHPANVFNDMNHYYSGTEYYSKRVMEHWLTTYGVDGFRFDLSKGFIGPNTNWDAYNPARIALWKRYADHIWSVNPDAYVILEHIGGQSEENELSNYGKGMMFWAGAGVNYNYNEATMGYNENGKSDLASVLAETKNFDRRNLIGYFESHDEQWLMFKNIQFGNSVSGYDITELNTALGRMKLAGAFFFTLPGPKMIWQFGELGYGYGDNGEQCLKPGDGSNGECPSFAPGRTAKKPIRWDYWNNPDTIERIKLYKTWSALLSLRHASPVFTAPETTVYDLRNSTKRITLTHADTDVVIIGNFGMEAITTQGNYTQTGTWFDYFGGTEIQVNYVEQAVTLEPGTFKIFTTRQFEAPEEGLLTSNESVNDRTDLPGTFRLYNNYPNPFNPATNLQFDLPKAGRVTLEVYDVTGRKVAVLVNEVKAAGNYSVRFDASELGSGIYFARLTSGNAVQTQKMILLK